MSGAAMGLTSAARGFIVFLLSVQVIQGQDDWGVTYTSPQICALKGTTVEIRCSYRYPSRLNDGDTTAERTFWIADRRPVDLRLDSNYAGRVQHHCDKRDCTLRIRDVRESDSAVYKLRFITQSNSYTGSPGVRLTVTGFQVQMSRIQSCSVGACIYAELNCHSSCPLTDHPSYIWYKNGQKMDKVEKSFYHYFYPADSYSCAVRGHEDVPSPSVCVHGQSCNRVTYDDRNICAFKGSTVYIYCTYNSDKSVRTKFWFSSDQSGYNTRPKDLRKDPQYAGRVQVFENERGRSILSISDLRERDSAEYHFKVTTGNYEWKTSLPGTTLTVTDPDLQVQVIWSPDGPKLICHSSCLLVGRSSFVWYKNDTNILGETSFSYGGKVDPADSYSCAHQGHRSPSVYAPKRPSVSVNHSAEIEEGSSVTLSCSSEANPAAKYSWYRKNQTLLSKKPQLVLSSIQSSDYGEYYCAAENKLGRRTSTYVFVNVKYAPKRPSVSVSPSAEIEEGSSVTLTCSSDANPAANYTWYKENQTLVHGPEGIYRLTSISSEDRGNYFCKSENQYGQIDSWSQYLDVKYAPKRLSVSVSPSAEVVEGSSVTLNCSSDANPAANYTWYKEDEDSPKASGQIFTITEFRSEHSGNYYCEAENNRGRRNSTLRMITVAGEWKSAAAGILTFLLVALIGLLVVFFLMKRSKSRKQQSDGGERSGDNRAQLNMGPVSDTTSAAAQRQPAEQQDELQYASISFAQRQEDALYSNIRPAQTQRHTEDEDDEVEYSSIKPDSSASGARRQENGEDLFALYSTVAK